MNFKELQKDMCLGYACGSTGILVSGLVWLIAGLVGIYVSNDMSVLTLFIGGMLIYPLGVLLAKLLKRSGTHQKNNPLGILAIETTVMLFIGLFLAYAIFLIKAIWFFPVMLMIIGLRYIVFQSIYGMKVYWILGLVLIIAGILCLLLNQPFHYGGIIGGCIELIFGMIVLQLDRKLNKVYE